MLRSLLRTASVVAAATLSFTCCSAIGADFPVRPVKVLNWSAPGSSGDLFMRLVATEIEQRWKQPMIIEAKPGAGGRIAYEAVARSTPDGYTLGWAISSLTALPALSKELSFSPERDLTGVVQLVNYVNSIMINSSIPAKNMKEFVAWLKANPGKGNYGSPGIGTTPHLMFEALKMAQGVSLTEVQFTNTPAALQAMLRSDVQIIGDSLQSGINNQKTGKARIIALYGVNERVAEAPEIETLAESGVLPSAPLSWGGIIGPAALPKDILNRLASDLTETVRTPDMRARITKTIGGKAAGSTPDEFNKLLAAYYKDSADLIKRLGIPPQ